jgi:hypothetical protein
MKPNDNELYEEWCYRARMFEHGVAMQRIAQGEDVELVLEEMTKRLLSKMMHPLFDLAKEEIVNDYDPVKSREEYKRLYLDKMNPVADHVINDEIR